MMPEHHIGRLLQPAHQMILALILSLLLVGIIQSMSGVGRPTGTWPMPPPSYEPTPAPAPDIAPLVGVPVDAG
jgi:hypothetical protein